MSRVWESLRTLNTEWNDLPRRILLIVALLLCLMTIIWVFPYVAPFALAALFAWIISPVVRLATRHFGNRKLVRAVVSGVMVVLLASVVATLALVLVTRVMEEIGSLASALPGWIAAGSDALVKWIDELGLDWPILEGGVEEALLRLLADATSTLTSLASRLATVVARTAWRAASVLPEAILFVVFTLMSTFYMSTDPQRIFSFLRGLLPEKYRQRSDVFKASILRAVLGQLRAALIMLLVTFGTLTVGFLLMGMDYAVLMALIIAVLDALPVIGAGLFLIPLALYGVLIGDAGMAVGFALMYILIVVVRQLLEPRIIGRQLGLYPLATMMAMYAGLKLMGFLGMLLGPMTLLLCKVALTFDPQSADTKRSKPAHRTKRKKRSKAKHTPPESSAATESPDAQRTTDS